MTIVCEYIQIRQLFQLLRYASFKPAHYSMHAREALDPFIFSRLSTPQSSLSLTAFSHPEKPPHNSLSFFLTLQTTLSLFEQPSFSPNQLLSHGVNRQTELYHRNFYAKVNESSLVAPTGCSLLHNNGESGSKLRYGVRKFTPFANCFSTFSIFEKFGLCLLYTSPSPRD